MIKISLYDLNVLLSTLKGSVAFKDDLNSFGYTSKTRWDVYAKLQEQLEKIDVTINVEDK
jgi:hypothetical protein